MNSSAPKSNEERLETLNERVRGLDLYARKAGRQYVSFKHEHHLLYCEAILGSQHEI